MAHILSLILITLFATTITAAPTASDTWFSHLNLTTQKRDSTVPFGVYLDRCVSPGKVALTFDDGPYIYTPDLLELLSSYGARATFFLNGQNSGNIYNNADIVKRTLEEGHQLGSHTWDHQYLTSLDYSGIVDEMTKLEDAFIQIIGAFPTYMRPPYLAVNSAVLTALGDLGYHVIGASIDTKDYANDDPNLISNSFEKFRNELDAGGSIVLSHDVHQQTVATLTQAMLDEIRARGLETVTVGECLGDPEGEWYRASR
ncbi:hypothetical protein ASPWEDRAFT_101017 [Aspergillus wentii DTO 134E9]|uniref:NodB homology domain-containing protein n=1 Tax=Aspergillus wentii DTO 134E9 TaxID=1073089 RepID=A0A1L9S0R1_ASPWE|nr:uncharacterized protein ASPWEDRAFT_101017 [Aspergillus wentii DTO 134E9]KAI9931246.1 hypothetical protein MW887_010908 [Aspergillus wentii]OJJ40742.1 hypothetical protein ASPWEDRAFT_101017 [Aspergillus wentii DTO 134E9]